MKRTSLPAVFLAASLTLASVAAVAAEAPQRYRLNRTPSQSTVVRVLRTGATWIEGTTDRGERVAVQFAPRFATVQRNGERVPVSFLRAGDRVEVTGRADGRRFQAFSAVLRGTLLAGPAHAASGAALCCTTACNDTCKACCAAGTCASTKECCTTDCSEACAQCCSTRQSAARGSTAGCCATVPAAAATAGANCCSAAAVTSAMKAAGCCAPAAGLSAPAKSCCGQSKAAGTKAACCANGGSATVDCCK